MNVHWPTEAALELLHGPDRCPTCADRQWVAIDDPLYPGELIDARCPDCVERARPAMSHPTSAENCAASAAATA